MKNLQRRHLFALALVAACAGLFSCASPDTPALSPQQIQSSAPDHSVSVDPAVIYANKKTETAPFYEGRYFEHEGQRLHYVEAGEGELVIFYHGFPSFWFSFFDQMEALKSRYRVVAIDGLGAGLSDKPDDLSPYKIDALANQLDAFARHLAGQESFILIGHDWGAALAWAYAQAYPERLNGVVGMSAPSFNVLLKLLETSPEQRAISVYMQRMRMTDPADIRAAPPGERIWRQSYGGLAERGDISEEEYALFKSALTPASATNGGYNWYRANIPAIDEISSEDYWPRPPGPITPPSLLIWGEQDRAFVPEFIDMMIENGTDMTVVRLPDVNHWTSMQKPEHSTEAIVNFLDDISRTD